MTITDFFAEKTSLNMHDIEQNAQSIRRELGLDTDSPFDPFEVIPRNGMQIQFPDEMEILPTNLRQTLAEMDAKIWSGGAFLHEDKLHILLNRNQSPERMNVTILEEVSHKYLNHKMNHLSTLGRENLNKVQEEEAYFTASAILVPAKIVAQAVYKTQKISCLSQIFRASEELIEMRIKLLSLWNEYKKGG
jgi:Zn-dependent peptidase ImmA (M78 family)